MTDTPKPTITINVDPIELDVVVMPKPRYDELVAAEQKAKNAPTSLDETQRARHDALRINDLMTHRSEAIARAERAEADLAEIRKALGNPVYPLAVERTSRGETWADTARKAEARAVAAEQELANVREGLRQQGVVPAATSDRHRALLQQALLDRDAAVARAEEAAKALEPHRKAWQFEHEQHLRNIRLASEARRDLKTATAELEDVKRRLAQAEADTAEARRNAAAHAEQAAEARRNSRIIIGGCSPAACGGSAHSASAFGGNGPALSLQERNERTAAKYRIEKLERELAKSQEKHRKATAHVRNHVHAAVDRARRIDTLQSRADKAESRLLSVAQVEVKAGDPPRGDLIIRHGIETVYARIGSVDTDRSLASPGRQTVLRQASNVKFTR